MKSSENDISADVIGVAKTPAEIFTFFNTLTLSCAILFALSSLIMGNFQNFLYTLVPVFLFALNLILFKKFKKLTFAKFVHFAVYDLMIFYSLLFIPVDSIAFLLVCFCILFSVLALSKVAAAIQLFFLQGIQFYSIFFTGFNIYAAYNVPHFYLNLLIIQACIIVYSYVIKTRNAKFAFEILQKFKQPRKKMVKLNEVLWLLLSSSVNSKVRLKRHDDCLHLVDKGSLENCIKEIVYRLNKYKFEFIEISSYENSVFLTLHTESSDVIAKNFLRLNEVPDKMKEYSFSYEHPLALEFRKMSLDVSFTLLPNEIVIKVIPFMTPNDIPEKENVNSTKKLTSIEACSLGKRELEVVTKILEGKTYKEVAWELDISINTVKTNMRRVFKKCDVQSTIELSNKYSISC